MSFLQITANLAKNKNISCYIFDSNTLSARSYVCNIRLQSGSKITSTLTNWPIIEQIIDVVSTKSTLYSSIS